MTGHKKMTSDEFKDFSTHNLSKFKMFYHFDIAGKNFAKSLVIFLWRIINDNRENKLSNHNS